MNDRVTIEITSGIADIRLNRADKMNALDPAMFAGIADALATLDAAPGLRCVVLSGEGRAFCAGTRHGEHGGRWIGAGPRRASARPRQPAAARRLGLARAGRAR